MHSQPLDLAFTIISSFYRQHTQASDGVEVKCGRAHHRALSRVYGSKIRIFASGQGQANDRVIFGTLRTFVVYFVAYLCVAVFHT
jgi:hypothetical protein